MATKTKKEEEIKNNLTPFVIVAIILIIGVIIVLIYSNIYNNPIQHIGTGNIIQNENQKNCQQVQVPYEVQEQYMKTEYYTEKVPYTNNVCDSINMVYKESLSVNSKDCIQQECINYAQVCSKKNWLGNCIEYTNGDCTNYKCVKYRISCGVKIVNQEKQLLIYSMNLDSYNYDTKQTSVIRVQDIYVSPLDNREYLWDFTALPTDNFGCIYVDNSVPTMKNCHDVIAYQDVQRERQVTAYRPVTKYRTETKCG